ncbi:MAG: protein kinase [Myxococcota bacterium]
MVERNALLSTLPEEVRNSAELLISQTLDPDPHDIVAELHRRGLLRDDQLRSALLTLEGSLRGVRMRARPPTGGAGPTMLGPLGAGAMGEVLLAKDEGLNRIVAVKRLLPELGKRPAVVERFYREAQITAQLDHPAIVPIHSLVSSPDGALAYSMKLVRGETFEDYLTHARAQWRSHGRESGEHVLSARLDRFLQVCEAVAYAHDRGVVHRDLKPENVMVGRFGQVLVMDWGIAKVLQYADPAPDGSGEIPTPKSTATRAGAVFGTPRYMSPEQARGENDKVDGKSDQYTLGLILSEVVTLVAAIPENLEVEGCLMWAASGRRRPMKHLHRSGAVARELVAIVDKATQLEPAKRYPSVLVLAEDIRRFLRDEAVSARPDTLGQRVNRWVGRHRSTMVSLVSLLAFSLVATGASLLVGSVVVIEWRRRAAEAHEQAVTELVSVAAVRGGEVHEVMDRMEAALVGLSYATEAALDRKDLDLATWPTDPLQQPFDKDRGRGGVYSRPVSLSHPSFSAPDGGEAISGQAKLLDAIGPALARPLVDAATDEQLDRRERRETVVRTGSPIRWVKVATSLGLVARMPGIDAFRSGVDGRALDWYRKAGGPGGVVWSDPHVDPDGMGLVLTGTLPVFENGVQIATAAVDVSAAALIEQVRPPFGATDAMLVSPSGSVMLWNGLDPAATSWAPRPLPLPELLEPLKYPEGVLDLGATVAAWSTVEGLGWRYLVLVDAAQAGSVRARDRLSR